MKLSTAAATTTADTATASGPSTPDAVPGSAAPDHPPAAGPSRVIVVGGGLGGLALGAGLRGRGLHVTVLERDSDLTATGGYHITLDEAAQTALRALLPPARYEAVLASASALRLRQPDAFFDHRGRRIGTGPSLASDPSIDIDRVTLRLLLADAAGDDLRTGATVDDVTVTAGRPVVTLADGERLEADLVVAADGTHSRTARRLAGGATNAPAGIVGWSGRTPADALSSEERDRLGRRSSLAVGADGAALYVGFLDPVGNAVLDRPAARPPVSQGPTYIWGAMFPDRGGDAGGDVVAGLVERFAAHGWRRDRLEVITRTLPGTAGRFRFHAAPTAPELLAPWRAGPVTAIGDAVHATPPTAGMGAGAALRDAATLAELLVGVVDGRSTLAVAVRDHEHAMRERGAAVVGVAMTTVDRILATATPVGSALTRATLPVAALAYRLRTGIGRS